MFDERHVRRAAAQRFNPDRAGTCVPVEHARAPHRRAEHIEERLAKPIRRRAQPLPRGSFQLTALEFTGNDTQSRIPDP